MKTTQAVLLSAGLLVVIGTLAVLDAEQNAGGSNIKTPSTALWWAVGNVTSVSYNSAYPVTTTGKIVAIALTIVGLSLIGVITAAVAAWSIAQTKVAAEQSQNGMEIRLTELEAKINAIHDTVCSDNMSDDLQIRG
jgi:voltage-gated potassium channel